MAQPQPVVQSAWILSRTAASSGWAAAPVPVLIGKSTSLKTSSFSSTPRSTRLAARAVSWSLSVGHSIVLPVEASIICSERFQIAVVNATRLNAPSSTHLATTNAKKLSSPKSVSGPLEILCTCLAFWMALPAPLCVVECHTVFLSLPVTETRAFSFERAFPAPLSW